MAAITNSNAKKYRYLGQEDDNPINVPADTLREKILRNLVQKQLMKCTSFEQLLQDQREFIKATTEESITANTSGFASYDDYKRLAEVLNLKEILSSCGLTDKEAQFLLNQGNTTSLNEAPFAREQRLKAIEDKLSERLNQLENYTCSFPVQFNGSVPLNRHEYEEACKIIPATADVERLTSCLVRLQPHVDAFVPDEHPINHITDIAEELFSPKRKKFHGIDGDDDDDDDDSHEPRVKSKSRKCKYEVREWGEPSKNYGEPEGSCCVYLTEKPKSLWDMKHIPKIAKRCEVNKTPKVHSKCEEVVVDISKQRKDTGKLIVNQAKPFVLTLSSNELIPVDMIKSNKKTVHELKAVEKFKNYSEGTPSVTLYIKNLPDNCSPKDLASLMGHFESSDAPKIQYRILNGRMRGQAFVTFPSKEAASDALNLCNGYILHKKPIVIQFGKHGS